ncbi:MAG: P-type conjugative transfer ATPase TrbB [Candidatus Anaerobiospirillum pullicola]|uniref:P-type conjugative transfer ATPase TrbB n=1 Tax=Candidatus Anaerobiospirillum pullicola TaxID=2838451 RepID=A0A948THW8_9GAMM|nr:P-type conjugative transfer ATPase TrbB [Candidatus Anaerobiospirillum pullicola]
MSDHIKFKNAYDQSGFAALMERFGPIISDALQDEEIDEIMLNSDGALFVEDNLSGMEQVGVLGPQEAESIIRTLASLLDKELDLRSPILSGEIPYNGSRFEGLLPPLVRAPVFSIRRHNSLSLPLDSIIESGMLSPLEGAILRQALENHYSIIVSGATGTGKTTLINALINEISVKTPQERIITIEDTPELQVNLQNKTNLFTSEEVDMSMLLRSALRLRPDRIIVGEVRGAEALDLVDALSTGHRGGLATVHAGSIEQALQRLTLLISRHKAAPRFIEKTLADSLDLVVQLQRHPTRHVSAIAQVIDYRNNEFQLQKITTEHVLEQGSGVSGQQWWQKVQAQHSSAEHEAPTSPIHVPVPIPIADSAQHGLYHTPDSAAYSAPLWHSLYSSVYGHALRGNSSSGASHLQHHSAPSGSDVSTTKTRGPAKSTTSPHEQNSAQ